jgi:hypothetical protein
LGGQDLKRLRGDHCNVRHSRFIGGLIAACVLSVLGAHHSAAASAAGSGASTLIPTTLKGPGSLTGVWINTSTGNPVAADGRPIPLLPEVAQRLAKLQSASAIDTQSAPWCVPSGMPSVMHVPVDQPLQFLETPGQITVLFELLGTFRIIRLNAKHPPDPDPTYFGHSVGRWEGEVLVVDTIALIDKTTVFGAPHSENLHVVERIRLTGESTLENRITIDDPKTFSRPWTSVISYRRGSEARLREYERRPC